MWLFELTFCNMEDFTERKVTMQIEEQFFTNSEDAYIYAVQQGFKLKKENECFGNLEFIAN